MEKMDSPAVCAICAMLTAGKSNHLVEGMQFLSISKHYYGVSKNHGRSERVMVKSTDNCGKMAEWMSLGCWLE